jgi:protein-S-isoprenylcysteine O-methyltransferase Ste14
MLMLIAFSRITFVFKIIKKMQKIIPPFLLLISALVMTILHSIVPYQVVIFTPFNYLGIALIILGLTIAKKVGNSFSKIDTEIHTFKKPRQLVTAGLFQYSRNPIYLGFVIALIGLNIVLGSLTPFIIVLIFIFLTNYWYIPFEEKNMNKQFGQDYENYKKRVRRWI